MPLAEKYVKSFKMLVKDYFDNNDFETNDVYAITKETNTIIAQFI